MARYVYAFEEGSAEMRPLLGGKGSGLAEMTRMGLPVPPGFTITTQACREFFNTGRLPPGLEDEVRRGVEDLERKTRKIFGGGGNPLLVSIRSGAAVSMPGMMDTVLNVGLNDETVRGIAKITGDERFALDAYRRLLQMYGRIVMGIPGENFEAILDRYKARTEGKKDTDLTGEMLRSMVEEFKEVYQREKGRSFPQDPYEQLFQAVDAVFRSWNGKRAIDYRNFNNIPHDLGTAVNVVAMVFGNMDFNSGTGVAFTRNPATGEQELFGEYLPNAQGEDVVAGIRTPIKIVKLQEEWPQVYDQLLRVAETLERHYKDVQDLEFTVERGKLWMLQTRRAQRTAAAAVKIAVHMAHEGLITKDEALLRVDPKQVHQLLLPRFDEEAKEAAKRAGKFLAKGLDASPGAGVGQVVFDPDEAERLGRDEKKDIILVRRETSPDDVHGMLHAKGILTARGGATSHAAVVARGLGLPCVAGCEVLQVDEEVGLFEVDGRTFREGDFISIDGNTGEVFAGALPKINPHFEQEVELNELLQWADERARLRVWANADYPEDALRARSFGAMGIGLCRTEHMFFQIDRLPIVRDMILSAPKYRRVSDQLQVVTKELETAKGSKRGELEKRREQLERDLGELSPRYLGSLERLGELQREDFRGILEAMAGLPVVIRLIDPPLHEFLPKYESLLVQVTKLTMARAHPEVLVRSAGSKEDDRFVHEVREAGGGDLAKGVEVLLARSVPLLEAVATMRETNPMLGLRGCRLGILFPQITEMQVRAIFEAACELKRKGVDVHPEIMIPLVGHVNELRIEREKLEEVAKRVMAEEGVRISYKFGTMIEIPRAALTAEEIARYAEFFSFGTNDLTQTTFGYSRDDAEGKFLLHYVEHKVLPYNPFQVLDRDGVGQLMQVAVQKGRMSRPDIKLGICGEHGGDPQSIEFCHELGLNYVSCSPFRVPVARLASSHAALKASQRGRD